MLLARAVFYMRELPVDHDVKIGSDVVIFIVARLLVLMGFVLPLILQQVTQLVGRKFINWAEC